MNKELPKKRRKTRSWFQEDDQADRTHAIIAESVAWPPEAPNTKTTKINVKSVSRLEGETNAKDGEIEERITNKPPAGSVRNKRQAWEDLEKAPRIIKKACHTQLAYRS